MSSFFPTLAMSSLDLADDCPTFVQEIQDLYEDQHNGSHPSQDVEQWLSSYPSQDTPRLAPLEIDRTEISSLFACLQHDLELQSWVWKQSA